MIILSVSAEDRYASIDCLVSSLNEGYLTSHTLPPSLAGPARLSHIAIASLIILLGPPCGGQRRRMFVKRIDHPRCSVQSLITFASSSVWCVKADSRKYDSFTQTHAWLERVCLVCRLNYERITRSIEYQRPFPL